MVSKISRLLAVFLIVALSLYIVILNRDSIVIRLGPSTEISTSAGVIFIALFCLGILATTLVATFFGFKSYLRERRLLSQERSRELFYQSVLQARSALAVGESGKARNLWQQVLRRDPQNIVARVELSKSLELDGETEEALKTLDAARSEAPQNMEVLIRAAELNLSLGNKTAAIDNLALVLYQEPSAKAAKLARDLSEDLGRIDDALEYHAKVERLDPTAEENEAVAGRLEFKKLLKEAPAEPAALSEALRSFTKKNPENAPALEQLAEAEERSGNIEGAAQAWVKAAKLTKRLDLWQRAMKTWVAGKQPERALATARSAAKEVSGSARLDAELNLVRTYILLDMFQEAQSALGNIPSLAKSQSIEISPATERELAILRAICLLGLSSHKEALEALKNVAHDAHFALSLLHGGSSANPPGAFEAQSRQAPAPRLSTP